MRRPMKVRGKKKQPDDKTDQTQAADHERRGESGRAAVLHVDHDDGGHEAEKTDRPEDQPGQENLRGDEEKPDDEQGDNK